MNNCSLMPFTEQGLPMRFAGAVPLPEHRKAAAHAG
jgi:hypothetical protein